MTSQAIVLRVFSLALGLFLSLAGGGRAAAEPDGLYSATTIITGTLEQEKRRGFAECLEQVLVKVSGDAELAGSAEATQAGLRAAELVETYTMRDRMAGIPIHDEQGTRERPHLLTATFSRDEVDRLLREFGRAPWLDRPNIVLAIGVDNGARRFVLARDSALGIDQRDALSEIADRLGLKLVLPEEEALKAVPLDPALLSGGYQGQVETLRRAAGGGVVLSGFLVWEDRKLRWWSRWRLVTDAAVDQWQVTGASFDAVFHAALSKTMRVLAAAERE